ncbi:hypothetical protein UUU_22520 [Klebsiella pneumoniae subsp. pneumoniae DSM 30104 = JCM 1662 = NBRC 14940]|nr:hypothetical protein UUU_22520 [Klebsiella pneumoniae subsp. pneumoniae DSM 30104 = JCM 1662 = NBRC 14940]
MFIFIFHGVAPSVLQRKASKRYHLLNFKFTFFTSDAKPAAGHLAGEKQTKRLIAMA